MKEELLILWKQYLKEVYDYTELGMAPNSPGGEPADSITNFMRWLEKHNEKEEK